MEKIQTLLRFGEKTKLISFLTRFCESFPADKSSAIWSNSSMWADLVQFTAKEGPKTIAALTALLDRGLVIAAKGDVMTPNAFQQSIIHGHLETAKLLRDHNPVFLDSRLHFEKCRHFSAQGTLNRNTQTVFPQSFFCHLLSPVQLACYYGHAHIVEWLVKNCSCLLDGSALYLATIARSPDAARFILQWTDKHGADKEQPVKPLGYRTSALEFAYEKGNYHVVSDILKSRYAIPFESAVNMIGQPLVRNTFLHWSVLWGWTDQIESQLQNVTTDKWKQNSMLSAKNRDGYTAIQLAAMLGRTSELKQLHDYLDQGAALEPWMWIGFSGALSELLSDELTPTSPLQPLQTVIPAKAAQGSTVEVDPELSLVRTQNFGRANFRASQHILEWLQIACVYNFVEIVRAVLDVYFPLIKRLQYERNSATESRAVEHEYRMVPLGDTDTNGYTGKDESRAADVITFPQVLLRIAAQHGSFPILEYLFGKDDTLVVEPRFIIQCAKKGCDGAAKLLLQRYRSAPGSCVSDGQQTGLKVNELDYVQLFYEAGLTGCIQTLRVLLELYPRFSAQPIAIPNTPAQSTRSSRRMRRATAPSNPATHRNGSTAVECAFAYGHMEAALLMLNELRSADIKDGKQFSVLEYVPSLQDCPEHHVAVLFAFLGIPLDNPSYKQTAGLGNKLSEAQLLKVVMSQLDPLLSDTVLLPTDMKTTASTVIRRRAHQMVSDMKVRDIPIRVSRCNGPVEESVEDICCSLSLGMLLGLLLAMDCAARMFASFQDDFEVALVREESFSQFVISEFQICIMPAADSDLRLQLNSDVLVQPVYISETDFYMQDIRAFLKLQIDALRMEQQKREAENTTQFIKWLNDRFNSEQAIQVSFDWNSVPQDLFQRIYPYLLFNDPQIERNDQMAGLVGSFGQIATWLGDELDKNWARSLPENLAVHFGKVDRERIKRIVIQYDPSFQPSNKKQVVLGRSGVLVWRFGLEKSRHADTDGEEGGLMKLVYDPHAIPWYAGAKRESMYTSEFLPRVGLLAPLIGEPCALAVDWNSMESNIQLSEPLGDMLAQGGSAAAVNRIADGLGSFSGSNKGWVCLSPDSITDNVRAVLIRAVDHPSKAGLELSHGVLVDSIYFNPRKGEDGEYTVEGKPLEPFLEERLAVRFNSVRKYMSESILVAGMREIKKSTGLNIELSVGFLAVSSYAARTVKDRQLTDEVHIMRAKTGLYDSLILSPLVEDFIFNLLQLLQRQIYTYSLLTSVRLVPIDPTKVFASVLSDKMRSKFVVEVHRDFWEELIRLPKSDYDAVVVQYLDEEASSKIQVRRQDSSAPSKSQRTFKRKFEARWLNGKKQATRVTSAVKMKTLTSMAIGRIQCFRHDKEMEAEVIDLGSSHEFKSIAWNSVQTIHMLFKNPPSKSWLTRLQAKAVQFVDHLLCLWKVYPFSLDRPEVPNVFAAAPSHVHLVLASDTSTDIVFDYKNPKHWEWPMFVRSNNQIMLKPWMWIEGDQNMRMLESKTESVQSEFELVGEVLPDAYTLVEEARQTIDLLLSKQHSVNRNRNQKPPASENQRSTIELTVNWPEAKQLRSTGADLSARFALQSVVEALCLLLNPVPANLHFSDFHGVQFHHAPIMVSAFLKHFSKIHLDFKQTNVDFDPSDQISIDSDTITLFGCWSAWVRMVRWPETLAVFTAIGRRLFYDVYDELSTSLSGALSLLRSNITSHLHKNASIMINTDDVIAHNDEANCIYPLLLLGYDTSKLLLRQLRTSFFFLCRDSTMAEHICREIEGIEIRVCHSKATQKQLSLTLKGLLVLQSPFSLPNAAVFFTATTLRKQISQLIRKNIQTKLQRLKGHVPDTLDLVQVWDQRTPALAVKILKTELINNRCSLEFTVLDRLAGWPLDFVRFREQYTVSVSYLPSQGGGFIGANLRPHDGHIKAVVNASSPHFELFLCIGNWVARLYSPEPKS
eukprot:GILJ01010647.1.p1 GENE.GILJ01010647.1~~GILJ01010647.1.p1  ORF type:complete len:2090 (-),score=301.81 GILJ01010647.1:177-6029(-)